MKLVLGVLEKLDTGELLLFYELLPHRSRCTAVMVLIRTERKPVTESNTKQPKYFFHL